ncbi:hypothetical protein GO755_00190 [Spirosoma sp. HMF4905]|uniref:KOW domain-containing protein n=1 Tax=Spirosoma arboris TaxID=2682092 RepID=A0A7K1S3Q3_9BACT|nr:hypothetical protein [Spirosoma arboris]MVM28430.1 hypothetical protein [Spirosoma arboris]
MATELNPGDRVEITRTAKGGYYKGRYLATVVCYLGKTRIKVRDEAGRQRTPFSIQVKRIA